MWVTLGVDHRKKYEKLFNPIYYSRKALNGVQKNYTVTDKDLLVVINAFKKFWCVHLVSKMLYTPIMLHLGI